MDGETVEGIDVVHYGEQQHLAWRRLLERHSFKKMDCVSYFLSINTMLNRTRNR